MSDRAGQLDAILAHHRPSIAAHWKSCEDCGIGSPQAHAVVDRVVEEFFGDLKALPAGAGKAPVLAAMKRMYERLDQINADNDHGLLETDERELLVPLFVAAAFAAGLDPADYPDGEPGGEYRDF